MWVGGWLSKVCACTDESCLCRRFSKQGPTDSAITQISPCIYARRSLQRRQRRRRRLSWRRSLRPRQLSHRLQLEALRASLCQNSPSTTLSSMILIESLYSSASICWHRGPGFQRPTANVVACAPSWPKLAGARGHSRVGRRACLVLTCSVPSIKKIILCLGNTHKDPLVSRTDGTKTQMRRRKESAAGSEGSRATGD